MTAWMSSYFFKQERWSAFSVVGWRSPSSTLPSRSVTTRSSSVIVSYASDEGVSTTLPSGSRAEKLPAVPCTRFVRRLSCATQSRSSLISSAVPFGLLMLGLPSQHLGVHAVDGSFAVEEPGDVVGDQLRVVRFRVVGRAADVRREHNVVHRAERVVRGEVLTFEVVEARTREVARLQRRGQRV